MTTRHAQEGQAWQPPSTLLPFLNAVVWRHGPLSEGYVLAVTRTTIAIRPIVVIICWPNKGQAVLRCEWQHAAIQSGDSADRDAKSIKLAD